MKNKVYIAGAGSGDIGNLTLKVYEIIQKADVILYDNLVSDEIILLSKNCAILVDVGKISGYHKVRQDDINALLFSYSQKYECVLRLKGGDPLIFGRGAEEALYLLKNGADFEILPGVSSINAVPASFNIPLTHRGISSAFTVVTGKKKRGETLSKYDYISLSALKNTTLVFLMATSIYNQIANGLIDAGKEKNTKISVISNGTTAKEKIYTSTLDNLSKIKDTNIFATPSMLIVGDVVELSQELNSSAKILDNMRFVVNIPKQKDETLVKKLRDLGAQVVNVSTNHLEKNCYVNTFKDVIKNMDSFDYLCFTSAYAVEVFFDLMYENNIDIRKLGKVKIGIVGAATSDALKNKGIIPELMPSDYNSKSLAMELIRQGVENVVCVLPHDVKSDLYDVLISHDVKAKRLNVYTSNIGKVRLYNEDEYDIYVFTSPSSVLGLANSFEEEHFSSRTAFCIGEKTQNMALKHGFKTIVSNESSVDGLVKTICNYYKDEFYNDLT